MIEELKFLLDAMGNVDNIALYVLGGFAAYKLVIYLSGVGAAVMLAKLLITKIHDVLTRDKITRAKFGNLFFRSTDDERLERVMRLYTPTNYVHSHDTEKMIAALYAGLKKEP